MENSILIEKLKEIKLLVMDVDGTLTDAAMYYSDDGEALKRFSTRDGMGITLLKRGGIKSAIVTSEDSAISEKRALKLRIDHIFLMCHNKTDAVKELAEKLSISLENIAYIGDDINDGPVMKIVGVSACPADASRTILEIADYVCRFDGGNGAVREFIELILESQNKSITLTENW